MNDCENTFVYRQTIRKAKEKGVIRESICEFYAEKGYEDFTSLNHQTDDAKKLMDIITDRAIEAATCQEYVCKHLKIL
ncbi:MAG: hypothetical protein V3R67_08775 [Thermodesulfobacteriota bacterium]